MKILLASQSPRRKELLAGLGFDFETVSIDVEEIYPPETPVLEVPAYLSKLKADAFGNLKEDEILITADTVVILEGKILGKPKDENDAVSMLMSLSGKSHQVATAVSFKTKNSFETYTDVAEVDFDDIDQNEAIAYVKNYQPLDKAGAYGIQEWFGMAKIKKINGSFYTIMGFPTHIVFKVLKNLGGKL